jgi:hypothetical protein
MATFVEDMVKKIHCAGILEKPVVKMSIWVRYGWGFRYKFI